MRLTSNLIIFLYLITTHLYAVESEWINNSFTYILDTQSVINGGKREGNKTLGNLTISANFDLDKKLNIKNTKFYLSAMAMHGSSPQRIIGDYQLTSNIDTSSFENVNLYEFFFERNLSDIITIIFGIYDLSVEYNVNDPALMFIHSSAGTSTEFGFSGKNGPNMFPFLGAVLAIRLSLPENIYFKSAITDANPEKSKGFIPNYDLNKNEGYFSITEI